MSGETESRTIDGNVELLARGRPSSAVPASGDQRRSARRPFHCAVSQVTGTDAHVSAACAVSPDGAFLLCDRPPEVGTRIGFAFVLPLQPPTRIKVRAVVVRRGTSGVGVRFVEISSRDRALLVQYVHHMLADDSVKRIQQEFGDVVAGHLTPTAFCDDTLEALSWAAREKAGAKLIFGGRRFQLRDARFGPIAAERLTLETVRPENPPAFSVVYVAFARGELQHVFETVVLESNGTRLVVELPDRVYSTERRARVRKSGTEARAEIEVPYVPGGFITARVVDYDAGGFAVVLPSTALVFPGTRLPRCRLFDGRALVAEDAAVLRNVVPAGPGEIRAGFELMRQAPTRSSFERRQKLDLKRPFRDTLRTAFAAARARVAVLLGRHAAAGNARAVEVVRFRTAEKEEIVGILDRTEGASSSVDIGVVIAPAFGKRKEVLSLLAQTIVDNFQMLGKSAAVLRYDDVRSVGESHNDPGCTGEGLQALHYTFSQAGRDMDAAIRFLRRTAHPAKLSLVTVSAGAVPARSFIARGKMPPIDSWVALYGSPDLWDLIRQALGEDVFALYRTGARGTKLFLGLPVDLEWLADAMRNGLETIDDAIADMSRIQIPVTWVVGAYDYWVRAERVRRLLDAPGGGIREIFEVPTGHLSRTGNEAVETFKLVTESIAKHALGLRLTARDPDLGAVQAKSNREWARVRRPRPADPVRYWSEHLFGKEGEQAGYDIVLTSATYARFLLQHHELAEIGPGMHVADLGCGTGNFAELAVKRALADRSALTLTCVDLVSAAIRQTEAKLEEVLARADPQARALVSYRCAIMDLEVSRLKPLDDFLAGALHGIEALAGRIEGMPEDLPARLRGCYSAPLHEIVRGRPASASEVRALVPGASDEDVEAVLDLSRAARFLRGRSLPEDTRGGNPPATADDLVLSHLRFPGATRRMSTDLPDETFDRAVCSLVVSYLYQPEETIADIFRALRPGGLLVVSSLKPNFDPSQTHTEMLQRINERTHDGSFAGETPESLRAMLHGFERHLSTLLELEEQGTFRFFEGRALCGMLEAAGFRDVQAFDSFGDPGQAVIARGTRPQA